MKKKILLLTTIYPAHDLVGPTKSIHYFTKEWVASGHKVEVMHFQAVYPNIFYFFARLFRKKIASLTGAIVHTTKDKGIKHYNMDGVSVTRIPLFKWFPHAKFTNKSLKNSVSYIYSYLNKKTFVPEIVSGHFTNPQLQMLYVLKNQYGAKTCLVMHDGGDSIKKIYKKNYKELFSNVDIWGYRSKAIKESFEKNYGVQEKSFMCYSGVPEQFIANIPIREFPMPITRFVYIGEMIKRKYPDAVMRALALAYPKKNFQLTYVGDGGEKHNLENLAKSLKLEENVVFLGRMPREAIVQILDNSDCMIMISKGEAFGLVHLEAMARGCLAIGSFKEGIDGVIINEVNGFLCQSGDYTELAVILNKINGYEKDILYSISKKAVERAYNLTDKKVAEIYLEAIIVNKQIHYCEE